MSAAHPMQTTCRHAEVDAEIVALLMAEDRLAAALAAPVGPGTSLPDLRMWLLGVYRHIAGSRATAEGACALLRRHPASLSSDPSGAIGKPLCVVVRVGWVRSAESEPLTDSGNARRLATRCGVGIAYDARVGWRVWGSSAWQADPEGVIVQRWAKTTVARELAAEADALHRRVRVEADTEGKEAEEAAARLDKEAKQASAWALKSQSANAIAAMVKLVRDEPGVLTFAEQWDADPQLLACEDATAELREDGHVIRPPARADRLTRVTRATPGTGAGAPMWMVLLERALPDPEVRAYFQRLAGYSLLGENRERILVILIGPTSTAKSTVIEIILHVLGDHAGPFDLSLFRNKADEAPRPDLVTALGRRLIATTEASDRWGLHADAIKRRTGSDTMHARTVYAKSGPEQRPAFVPWIATNTAPLIEGADQALWRRLVVVPFTVQIPVTEQDTGLGERIRATEANGVLDWLLAGWDAYARDGLGDIPPACAQAAMELRSQLSHVDQWLQEQTDQDAAYTAPGAELWNAWKAWCTEENIPEKEQGTRRKFAGWLDARGYPTAWDGPRDGRYRVRTGLKLADHVQRGPFSRH